ncbi:tRNA dihydrouridine synthase A [Candidatus Symbiobacter mobilis CR]|uniref:tRNA-dihydrouridine(20/20a) synthase n=2 Tax=Candidatus Symbiobacter TaxID=1436289 RepID=U5N550_9BURK|nr:tRNA dihydrouridine synthase A [Candidatus Symbiobacter mobilis CR]
MLDLTDRHCRHFHRLLTKRALLYTEMVTTGALLHGDVPRHLRHDEDEAPVALQLGGSDPAELAQCARLGEQWGYTEINLNCGCPSERVQRGAFGASLMQAPHRVAECVAAMCDAVSVPVTVKHRIGIDKIESYDFVRDFVGTVHEAGCHTFIVHARNAWLQGLCPAQNRSIPPLRPQWVYQLKREFPQLCIVLNGGVTTNEEVRMHLDPVDGVMLGRAAYRYPWLLHEWDGAFFGTQPRTLDRDAIERQMVEYMHRQARENGTPWPSIARHMLGLRHGLPAARRWRQVWGDASLRQEAPERVMEWARIGVLPVRQTALAKMPPAAQQL